MRLLGVSFLYVLVLGSQPALEGDFVVLGDSLAAVAPLPADARIWRSPIYHGQEQALGYGESVFSVPAGMEKQVQFWVDIYGKYSTEQGVIHDSETFHVYDVVDLSGLHSEAQRQRRVDVEKSRIAKTLNSQDEVDNLRYQLGQKDRMEKAIFYSGRYLEEMEEIFREHGLPIELTRLAFVESSFDVFARSKVGASGIWQIMKYTARPYRMVSSTVDKRNHPIEATKVAAKLLRSNYIMLKSWPLAITGYNHGPTGVLKLTRHHKTRNISELVQITDTRKSLGFASRNFYASFLASLEVEKNAPQYFGSVVWSKPLPAQELALPKKIKYNEILAWFDGDDEQLQLFNPHLTSKARRRPIPARTRISVPTDKYEIVMSSLNGDRKIASGDRQ